MTVQEILETSLDWQDIMREAGVELSEQTRRAVNSLTDYLCAMAELGEPVIPARKAPHD